MGDVCVQASVSVLLGDPCVLRNSVFGLQVRVISTADDDDV